MADLGTTREPIIEVRHLRKTYSGITVLKDVNFRLYPGEVNALVGENGAGKSTMIKIIAGVEKPDRLSEIYFDGVLIHNMTPSRAMQFGIAVIYQDLSMFPNLSIAENLFIGRNEGALFSRREIVRKAVACFRDVNIEIDPCEKLGNLSVGQQQIVEIAKTMLQQELMVLIMDEPTSSLSSAEVEVLFKLIEDLKRQGIAVIYISHRLEEIIRICDNVTVLRDGNLIATAEVKDISIPWIIEKMVGHATLSIEKPPYTGPREPVLIVEDYCLPRPGGGWAVNHVSFTLHRGEVLGIYGLMGAGRTELVESLMGLHPEATGRMTVRGEVVEKPDVAGQIRRGMVLVPEDRQKDGLVQTMSIYGNLRLTAIPRFTRRMTIDEKRCRRQAGETIRDMQIKVSDVNHLITSLSGGNQQKVVIGKCVMARADIFMMDEPSRGIDVGAKTDIFTLMRRFAAQGMGVLFVGSELKEILSVCDRVLVMSNGVLTADLSADEMTESALVKASAAALHTA